MSELNSIAFNLGDVRSKIAAYALKHARNPQSIALLAASKGQSVANIQLAINAGQRLFGENYVQEALPKILALASESIEWHFIGPIQQNKTRKIAENFDWVHSVSDLKIAKRLNDQRPDSKSPLSILVQVNVSDDLNKSGISFDQVEDFCEAFSAFPNLRLKGLMTIPAEKNQYTEQALEFNKLHQKYILLNTKGLHLECLSMGMSNDMEAAIAEGSTIVRVGRAIFGER